MRRLLTTVLACAALTPAHDLDAQSRATPFVPADHWSAHAVDHLHALGLAPAGTVRGERSRTVAEVLAALRNAADRHDVARDYLRRFDAEFGSDSAGPLMLTHASVRGGAGTREGDVAHGTYSTWGEENWTGAVAREDRTTATGRGALLIGLGEYMAAGAVASGGPHRTAVDELYGLARIGNVALWGGRRMQGYGPGTSGMVMSGLVPVDGAGIHVEPFRLPWLFRHLGPVRGDITVALPDANGPVEQPYFILTRGSIEPHPRVGFGVTRGGMIGAVDEHVSVGDVLLFLAGAHTDGSEYDNQVAAVDAWFRPPAGSLPLLLYVEWGAEDSAGSWWDVPGIIAGAELAAVPGLPWLSVVLERTSFEGSNSGNPPWYRHPIGFHDGWSMRGELLGHPLGGHGREWLVQSRANLMDGRLQLMARGFRRTRLAENVYAPERAGRSTGFAAGGDLQLRPGVALQLEGSTESGSGWRRTVMSGALQLYLPHAGR